MRTSGALVHAWDPAKPTSQPANLDPELGTGPLAASGQRVTGSLRGRERVIASQFCATQRDRHGRCGH